jgi:hypothetical protein
MLFGRERVIILQVKGRKPMTKTKAELMGPGFKIENPEDERDIPMADIAIGLP